MDRPHIVRLKYYIQKEQSLKYDISKQSIHSMYSMKLSGTKAFSTRVYKTQHTGQ